MRILLRPEARKNIMIQCRNCGSLNKEEDKKCFYCGTKLEVKNELANSKAKT